MGVPYFASTLRRPNFPSGEGLVKFWVDLVEKRNGQILTKCDTKRDGQASNQADKQANNCQIYIRMDLVFLDKKLIILNNWPFLKKGLELFN